MSLHVGMHSDACSVGRIGYTAGKPLVKGLIIDSYVQVGSASTRAAGLSTFLPPYRVVRIQLMRGSNIASHKTRIGRN